MKRRFPFLVTVIISLAAVYFVIVAELQLGQQFNWPWWVYLLVSSIAFILFFEIPARLGPRPFETPISLLRKESIRDRIVISIAVLVFLLTIIIAYSIRRSLSVAWIQYTYFVIAFLLSWVICFFFGSEKLRNYVIPDRAKEAGNHDKVVILVADFTSLICLAIAVSITLSLDIFWIVKVVFVAAWGWIVNWINHLFCFLFGSQKLRDDVTPKWLKDAKNRQRKRSDDEIT